MCPDAVKPDVPVVMDFGYLTRSVLADYCTLNLTDLLNMFIASFAELSLVLFLLRMLLCLRSPCPLVLLLSFLVSSFAFYFAWILLRVTLPFFCFLLVYCLETLTLPFFHFCLYIA